MKRAATYRALLFSAVLLTVAGCATQRAVIEKTASGEIIWPGPPEQPRIKFLWSLSVVQGSDGKDAMDILAGDRDSDSSDPQTSSRLLRPYSVFLDGDLLYITDPGAYRVSIVDLKASTARNILAAGDVTFQSPIGVVAFRERVYVSDSSLAKVFIFTREGKRVGEFEGQFKRPTAMALDKTRGVIYLADSAAHVVYRYDAEGKRLGSIGRNGSDNGEFNFPTHLWVDGSGRLYVVDAMNFRVQIFSPAGTFESVFGTLGDVYGNLEKPKGAAVDSDGNIYVIDSIKDMVKIFNRNGELLLFFGREGRNYGEFWLPSGIFIDDKDTIYVADSYNGRVQAFTYLKGGAK